MRQELTENTFYVKKIYNVVKATHHNAYKTTHVRSRFYDVFLYVLAGRCLYTFEDGTEFELSKGDILFMTHTEKYFFQVLEPDFKYIFCDFSLVGDIDCKSTFFHPKNEEYAENLFRKLHTRFNTPSQTAVAESISIFYDIYSLLMTTANSSYMGHSARSRIDSAKSYIDLNYKSTSLSISELAESAKMSEVYFRKLFKARFGISPSQYITSIRLNKAKELMKSSFLTLEDCALQSGFSSLQYFCRVFKKATGVTPYNYRKQQ